MKTYTSTICPVCGYDGFDHIPEEFDICPSCHFEFAVNDYSWTYEELRQDWIQRGAKWASNSPYTPRPTNWNAAKQLMNIFSRLTSEDKKFIAGYRFEAEITDLKNDQSSATTISSPIWTLIIPSKRHYVDQICAGV